MDLKESIRCLLCNGYGRLPLGSVFDGVVYGWTECPRCKGAGKIPIKAKETR